MARTPRTTEIPQGERRGQARLDLHLALPLKRALAMAAAARGCPIARIAEEAIAAHPDVCRILSHDSPD